MVIESLAFVPRAYVYAARLSGGDVGGDGDTAVVELAPLKIEITYVEDYGRETLSGCVGDEK